MTLKTHFYIFCDTGSENGWFTHTKVQKIIKDML